MTTASSRDYLAPTVEELKKTWPNNRAIHIVCHGHSVPAGYFATPRVDTFHAYPHLLHRLLNDRFPYAVINVIVTAIGGENSIRGAERFSRDVLCHKPDVLTIDYGLNDRSGGLLDAKRAWSAMIEQALQAGTKVILLTPTWDNSRLQDPESESWIDLKAHARQIRHLAAEYKVGLVDSFAAFEAYERTSGEASDLLSWPNHPNAKGHELVACQLLRWFAYS
ncbi:MAG: SGNH/GDSL hydrolase family protein [Paenibacillaceae bacterium]|nr:SGNH/GDSL hydrolase family protein [Paenibacillaceae bacterium]